MYGENCIWTIAMSAGILEESGDVPTVHTIFPINTTHVPVNFIWVMPLALKNHIRPILRCSSHVDQRTAPSRTSEVQGRAKTCSRRTPAHSYQMMPALAISRRVLGSGWLAGKS